MTSRTHALLAILALTAVALPVSVNCQQQGAGVRVMPFTPARTAGKDIGSNSLPDLIQTLRQVQPSADESRARALDAIARLGPAAKLALPDILPLATNQNRQLKIRAFFALTSIGPDAQTVSSVVPTLMQALGDEKWTMRLAAIYALAALRPPPPDAEPVFVQLLNDSDEDVRRGAMHSLVAQTNPVVIPVLDKQLHDKDSYVVTEAATQIGVFGAAASASEPRLRELRDAPLLTVRQAATNALLAITGQVPPQPASAEIANIAYDFPHIPLEQFLPVYEDLAGKKVTMKATPKPGTLRVLTGRPLTKSQALQLLEEVLKEQAGLIIVHGPDGSLTAVARPNETQQ